MKLEAEHLRQDRFTMVLDSLDLEKILIDYFIEQLKEKERIEVTSSQVNVQFWRELPTEVRIEAVVNSNTTRRPHES